jgi:hypothetical protein
MDAEGRPTFSAAESARLDELTELAFQYCDPYAIGAAEFERILGLDPGCPRTD